MENTLVLGPLPSLYFGNGIVLPTYPLFISLLFTGLIFYVSRRAYQRDHSGATALDLFLWCVLAGAIGARVLHVVYEAPSYYIEDPLRVFYFWHGGFVFYGGLILGFLTGFLFLKIKKQSFALWLDFFTPILSLGYALGRWACFLTGCCYGKICDLPWAIAVRQIDLDTKITTHIYRHPTQLYASALEFGLFFLLLRFEKTKILAAKPGHLFFLWLGLHSMNRIFIETFRDDDRGAMVGVLSISMLLSLVFLAISLVILFGKQKPKSDSKSS